MVYMLTHTKKLSIGKVKKYHIIRYSDNIIDVINDHACLGVTTRYDKKCRNTIRKQLNQGHRAHFY